MNMLSRILIIAIGLGLYINLFSQGFIIEGYTYETGNRGYLSQVDIEVIDKSTEQILVSTTSNAEGFFSLDVPPVGDVLIKFNKEMFEKSEQELTLKEGKNFLKVEMERAPGYLFEITLADKKTEDVEFVNAISGALIEVYNNTTEKLVLKIEDHPDPEFKLAMEKGNHYTILVRKKGYLAKQMEAFVNVKGCILCFEGINDVKPGVTENLTSGNNYGTLLANVEMDKIYSGKAFDVDNLLYDLNSAKLKKESKKELDKVINVLRYNPNLTLELGSHTDSRGKNMFNMKLSKNRALSAVKYITEVGGIPKFRIVAAGYGETQLLNKCADGVTCSEEDHAKNRRTEIKVIGIDQEWIFKPLVNIKNEIKMEKEIFEMIHGKAEELSEEDYKKLKAIEKSSSLPVSNTKPQNNNDDIVILEVQDENITQAEIEAEAEKQNKIQLKKQAALDKKKAEFEKQTAAIKEKEEIAQKALHDALVEKNKLDSITKDSAKIIEEQMIEEVAQMVDPAEKSAYKIKEETEVIKPEIKEETIQDMPDDIEVKLPKSPNQNITDGYKIIIHFAGVPLNKNNPLFDKYENLEVYMSPDKSYYYMIPGYNSTKEAEDDLKDGLIAVYPSAYVAGFKGGRRIL